MNSQKKIWRAVRSKLAIAESRMMMKDKHPARRDHHPKQRRGQEHFPTEPHELIVAIARHHGLHHPEKEKEKEYFQQEPDDSWNEGERPDAERRQPAAEEQDRAHRAHQYDADILAEEEEQEWRRGVFDKKAGNKFRLRFDQVEGRPIGLGQCRDEEDRQHRKQDGEG